MRSNLIYFPNFIRTDDNLSGEFVNENTKFLFHHIPKTAGSTVRGILSSLFKTNQICKAETVEELSNVKNLDKYKLFAGHFSYGSIGKYLSDAVWITFLREPNERVVSQYYNHINPDRIPQEWKDRVNNSSVMTEYINSIKNCSLKDWVLHKNINANAIACNRQTQAFIPQDIRVNIKDWSIYDSQLIKIAKKNLESKFTYFGIQEYFNESIILFDMTFGIFPNNPDSFTTNINKQKNFKKKYKLDNHLSNIIFERNQMDWELYEYAKELFFIKLKLYTNYLLQKNNLNNKNILNYFEDVKNIELINNLIVNERRHHIINHFDRKLLKNNMKRTFNIEQVLSVHGFHQIENSLKGKFRWTGLSKDSYIEINKEIIKDKLFEVTLSFVNIIDINILNSIKVFFNDIFIDDLMIKTSVIGNINVSFKNKISSSSSYHLIKISSDRLPEGTMENPRMIGLAFQSIKIKI